MFLRFEGDNFHCVNPAINMNTKAVIQTKLNKIKEQPWLVATKKNLRLLKYYPLFFNQPVIFMLYFISPKETAFNRGAKLRIPVFIFIFFAHILGS